MKETRAEKAPPAEKGTAAMALSAVIVDDEQLARQELAFLLKAHPEIELVAEGRNGLEAIHLIKEHKPDLMFLDVQMPGLDGFGVIKKLIEKKVKLPQVIFATAYDHYAVQAFDVNAVDYLLKPFDKGRLARAIQRARRLMETPAGSAERTLQQLEALLQTSPAARAAQPSKLLVRSQGRLFLVDSHAVVYATIEDGLITVVAQNLEGISNYRTIEELQNSLDPEIFWRVHRSYLVNVHKIKEVIPWFKSSYMLKMDDRKQTEIPVSRSQTRRLREFLRL